MQWMFKVIVTGATGFIGQSLCRALLSKGLTVYGVGRNQKILDRFEVDEKFYGLSLDFEEYSQMDKLIKDRDFDCFFHLANYGVNGADKEDYKIQLTNTLIACEAVDVAHTLGCKRFVFVGSVDEFEACSKPDSYFINPTHSRIYGIAKYSAECIGKVLAIKYDMEYVTALLALTYGEGNNTNILPNVLIRNSLAGKNIDLIEGNNTYDIIYVSEAIDGIIAISERGKSMESYYIGHEKLRTFKEIVNEINENLGNKCDLLFGKYKDHGSTIDYAVIDREKLRRDTGYLCTVELKDGILKTYMWIKNKYLGM